MAEDRSRQTPLPGFQGLVGESAAMQALFRRLERLAAVDVSVLIVGETGTGKELVAAALHRLSPRRAARFEAVNCGGAQPGAPPERALRPRARGVHRGRRAARRAPRARRTAGRVFLDEVGELPLDAQAVLLRFLGTGEVRPVGLTRTLHVDVRVIAATHRDLARGDPARHVPGGPLLPAPRGRPPRPAAPRAAGGSPAPGGALSPAVQRARRARDRRGRRAPRCGRWRRTAWPGNVRELEAVVREAMVLKGRGWLEAEDLKFDGTVASPPASTVREGSRAPRLRPMTRCVRVALEIAAVRGSVTRRRCGGGDRPLGGVGAARIGRARPARASPSDRPSTGHAVRGAVNVVVMVAQPLLRRCRRATRDS